jgi:SAM-dependent methyltransferase
VSDDASLSYGELAAWYDAIYDARSKDYAGEAAGLLELVRSGGSQPRSLLDVACGTGRHLEVFAGHLDDVAGLDNSTEMVILAGERLGRDVTLHEGDLRSFDLGRTFDVVTCLFSSIGHVADEEELDAAVATMARHVGADGWLLIEPWLTPDRVDEGGRRDVVTAETQEGVVARVGSSHVDAGALVIEFGWAVASPAGVVTTQEHHRMPLFTQERYLEAVSRAGLVASWYDDLPALGDRRGLLVGRREG